MKIFIFAASARKDSVNKKLVKQVIELLKAHQSVTIDHADFKEFDMPVYDGDREEESGIPEGGQKLIQRIQAADAVIISTPEYNGGIPGALKNAIDWVSRADDNPLENKPLLLIGASPGALGAVRGLWHTRVPFEAMKSFVYPEMFGLPKAHQAFGPDGKFIDPKNNTRLESLLQSYIDFASGQKK